MTTPTNDAAVARVEALLPGAFFPDMPVEKALTARRDLAERIVAAVLAETPHTAR
jgi:hypothetical protein